MSLGVARFVGVELPYRLHPVGTERKRHGRAVRTPQEMPYDRSSSSKRRKAGRWYLTDEELIEALGEAYDSAVDSASLAAHGGEHSAEEISTMLDRAAMLHLALEKILATSGA